MTISLTRVKDIGPVAAAALVKHGIDSVEMLASLSPAQVGAVPGFGLRRSERVIAAAKSLLATAESAGIDLNANTGSLTSPGRVVAAGKEGKDRKHKKKGKGKSGSKGGKRDKPSKKGKGGKDRDKGDRKRSARKKDEKKRDKKKGKKKK